MDIHSIDGAASGYIRYQFIRSIITNIAAIFGAVFMIAMFVVIPIQNFNDPSTVEVSDPIAAVGMTLGSGILATALYFGFFIPLQIGFYYWIHRKLLAVFQLFIALLLILGPAADFEWVVYSADLRVHDPITVALLAFRPFVLMVLGIEFAIYAIWQLSISKESFLAARGWRPSIWRVASTLRRNTGLPAFVANVGRGQFLLTLMYFLVAVLNGVWLFGLAGLPLLRRSDLEPDAANSYQQTMDLTTDSATLLLPALVLAIGLIGYLTGAPRLLGRVADKLTIRTYQKVDEWDARKPIIFLRAFDQDVAKLKADVIDPVLRIPSGFSRARTLDEILLEQVSPYGPLIAIGDPRTKLPPLGAARVFVPGDGEDWQATVTSLVDASKGVVMCAGAGAGVRWELELLASRYAQAWAIFIANPSTPEAETIALFSKNFASGAPIELRRGQVLVAAYQDAVPGRWRLLTAKRRNLATYVVALNMALQSMYGPEGEELHRPAKA